LLHPSLILASSYDGEKSTFLKAKNHPKNLKNLVIKKACPIASQIGYNHNQNHPLLLKLTLSCFGKHGHQLVFTFE
jgi:hypothetical protein